MKVSVNWDMTGSTKTTMAPGQTQVTIAGEPPFIDHTDMFNGSPGVFEDIQPGAYTASVQMFSADGIAIGSPVTAGFTVAEPPTVATPGNITVTVE